MKTNELKYTDLRIGNWVHVPSSRYYSDDEDDFCIVKSINQDSIDAYPFKALRYNQVEPIELTEDVLLKIGFEKGDTAPRYQRYYWEVYCENGKSLRLSYDFYYDGQRRLNITFREMGGVENEFKKYEIKYLHELQNAYFLLTGQEMEVEL